MNILACGCVQGDPLKGRCEQVYQLPDGLRKAYDLYELARLTASLSEQSAPERREQAYTAAIQAHEYWHKTRQAYQAHYMKEEV